MTWPPQQSEFLERLVPLSCHVVPCQGCLWDQWGKGGRMCLWEAGQCHSRTQWRRVNVAPKSLGPEVNFVPHILRIAGRTRHWAERTRNKKGSSSASPSLEGQYSSSLACNGIGPHSQESSRNVPRELCLILIFFRRYIQLDGEASQLPETLKVLPIPKVYS